MLQAQPQPTKWEQEGMGAADLANVAQLVPGLASPLLASGVDPVLHLCKASLDVLPIAEAAALPPQQQLVKQLHVHKAEELLEQLAHLQQHTQQLLASVL